MSRTIELMARDRVDAAPAHQRCNRATGDAADACSAPGAVEVGHSVLGRLKVVHKPHLQ